METRERTTTDLKVGTRCTDFGFPRGQDVIWRGGGEGARTSLGVWWGLMRWPSKRKRTAPGWRDLREQNALKIWGGRR